MFLMNIGCVLSSPFPWISQIIRIIKLCLALRTDIVNGEDLADIVAGNTKAEATALLQRNLNLNELDASALAGLLVAPTGNYISISHLIIPSSNEIVSIYLISFLHRA